MRLPSWLPAALPEDWRHGGFGLYLHWPFCQAKCPYCDFNSHVVAHIDQARWLRAYVSEIKRAGRETEGRVLQSVFFGGGTPSLMDPQVVDGIMSAIRATWPCANDMEVTLEANPTSVEAGRFAGYRDAGVNRVSMGIQALNDADLKALGRLHTADEAMRAFETARGVFDRVSFDLIYARQGQGLSEWQQELDAALSLAVDHVSLYQLTIEDGTAFGDRFAAGKLAGLPEDDLAADMYFATQEICSRYGFDGYEVSNHARPGQESRHNLMYWKSGDYVGIGPGAHGRLTLGGRRVATETALAPFSWLNAVEQKGSGEGRREALSSQDHLTEFVLMGLRVRTGVDSNRLLSLGGAIYMNNINELVENGWLSITDETVCVTEQGWPVLNGVLQGVLRD